MRTGRADLPLHRGRAPRWLFGRMVELAAAVSFVVVEEYSQGELLARLSDPFWFQAFGCALGFDWHSSGLTTTVCGALKKALSTEHGVLGCGGKGATSRKTPREIDTLPFPLSTRKREELKEASRMCAKVDSSCVQDSYQLYHHSFFVSERGEWTVVQQGMNAFSRFARRYHWREPESFVEEPGQLISCPRAEEDVLDMTARQSDETRETALDLLNDNPDRLKKFFRPRFQTSLAQFTLPGRHPVVEMDISPRGWRELKAAYELQPQSFEEFVSLRGIGPKKVRALALVSQLVHGTEPSWRDPVKYSFAHGGKDGHPYPVDKGAYDHSVDVLKDAVERARVGDSSRLKMMKRLSDFISS